MIRSLNAGVTGLKNHQTKIDVIGNNIANVNTNGYKAQRVEFQNLMSMTESNGTMPAAGRGGTNAVQVGLGVSTATINVMQSQGALQYTGKSTDLSMQGEGYFIMGDGKQQFYTRDGSFDFDSQGVLVRPANGLRVQGWMASNDKIDTTAALGNITISKGLNLKPNATTKVLLKGNLKADSNDIVLDGVIKGATPPATVSPDSPLLVGVKFLNSKNDVIHGALKFTNVPNTSTWTSEFTVDSVDQQKISGNLTQALGTVTFDPSGKLISQTLSPIRIAFSAGTGAAPIEANVIPSQLTQSSDPNLQASKVGLTPGSDESAIVNGARSEVFAGRYTMTVNFFDALGNSHAGNLVFSRDLDQQSKAAGVVGANSRWRVSFAHSDPTIRNDASLQNSALGFGGLPVDLGTVAFDQNGLMVEDTLQPLNVKYNNGAADSQLVFNPGRKGELAGLTQFTTSSTALVDDQNGYTSGTLQGFSIDKQGTIGGVFTNGQIRQLAQVAIATFNNPTGLISNGQNMWTVGNNSGQAQIGAASSGGRGDISSANLEMSNVDLAQSFADLITSQRGFQANSRIITTSDEILQELIQLKR